jgi:hypothetical protein
MSTELRRTKFTILKKSKKHSIFYHEELNTDTHIVKKISNS